MGTLQLCYLFLDFYLGNPILPFNYSAGWHLNNLHILYVNEKLSSSTYST